MDIETITNYMHIQTALPQQADLAFIFGTRHLDPVELVVDLYQHKLVNKIVLTGGVNRHTKVNEAQAHLDFLLEQQIPYEAIILEDASTNTYENVVFALPRIGAVLPFFETVLAIVKWYHARRALMTLKANFPPGIRYYVLNYAPEDVTPHNWHLTAGGQQRVLKNWQSIPRYLAAGHIAEIERQDDAYV